MAKLLENSIFFLPKKNSKFSDFLRKKKFYIFSRIFRNFRRVTHFQLCLLETQVAASCCDRTVEIQHIPGGISSSKDIAAAEQMHRSASISIYIKKEKSFHISSILSCLWTGKKSPPPIQKNSLSSTNRYQQIFFNDSLQRQLGSLVLK